MNEQVARLDCSDLDGDVTWRKGRKEGPLLIVVMGGVGGEEGDREPPLPSSLPVPGRG